MCMNIYDRSTHYLNIYLYTRTYMYDVCIHWYDINVYMCINIYDGSTHYLNIYLYTRTYIYDVCIHW